MNTQQSSTLIKRGFPVLLAFVLLFRMVPSAAATPYIVSITSPGEYIITGSFDSDLDTWSNHTDITNWSFSATILQPPFNVGPISQAIAGDNLTIFNGSVTTGITNLTAIGNIPALISFEEGGVSAIANFMTFSSEANFNTAKEKVTNSVEAVPEPSTALLLLTGLSCLAVYRWHRLRRERTPVESHTLSAMQEYTFKASNNSHS